MTRIQKQIILITGILLMTLQVFSHPWKPHHFVIIDTDGGIDDLRAISMLLSSPDVRVLGITVSPGAVSASRGYKKVNNLLQDYRHAGIPTGIHRDADIEPHNLKAAMQFSWGDTKTNIKNETSAAELIKSLINRSENPIEFVSLGSLSVPAQCIKDCPDFSKKIQSIYWSNDYELTGNAMNYSLDTTAYRTVENTDIPLHIISGKIKELRYSGSTISRIKQIETPYAQKFHKSLTIPKCPFAKQWFDESVPVFIHYPDIFTSDTSRTVIKHKISTLSGISTFQTGIMDILKGETINQNQIMRQWPEDTSAYFTDVQEIYPEALQKHGRDEWISGILAGELHRHLGVYTTIGIKMGIRAREYFGAGIDALEIVSYAGLQPPVSCMNDGLQASTGATIGHGLISVDTTTAQKPSAKFSYMGREIKLTLKEQYKNTVKEELGAIRRTYDLDKNIYWEFVRDYALRYWKNWDRHNMFTITEME